MSIYFKFKQISKNRKILNLILLFLIISLLFNFVINQTVIEDNNDNSSDSTDISNDTQSNDSDNSDIATDSQNDTAPVIDVCKVFNSFEYKYYIDSEENNCESTFNLNLAKNIVFEDVPSSLNEGRYSLGFWIYIDDSTKFSSFSKSIDIIYENHMSLSISADSSQIGITCYPVRFNNNFPNSNLKVSNKTTEGLNSWNFILCSTSLIEGVYWLNGDEEKLISPTVVYDTSGSKSTYFRHFNNPLYSSNYEFTNILVNNISNIVDSRVFIKSLIALRDYIPRDLYNFRFFNKDFSLFVDNNKFSSLLLFYTDLSISQNVKVDANTQQATFNYSVYTSINSASVSKTSAPVELIKDFEYSKATSDMKQFNLCNYEEEKDKGTSNVMLSYSKSVYESCVAVDLNNCNDNNYCLTKINNNIKKYWCNDDSEYVTESLECSSSTKNGIKYKKNSKYDTLDTSKFGMDSTTDLCPSNFYKFYFYCIPSNKENNGIYFSSEYGFEDIVIDISSTSYLSDKKQYILEVWFFAVENNYNSESLKSDLIIPDNENLYYVIAPPNFLYKENKNSNKAFFYYNDSSNVKDIGTINLKEWNNLLVISSDNKVTIYFNYNEQTKVIIEQGIIDLKGFVFCNQSSSCNLQGDYSNIYWGNGFYKNIRLWNTVKTIDQIKDLVGNNNLYEININNQSDYVRNNITLYFDFNLYNLLINKDINTLSESFNILNLITNTPIENFNLSSSKDNTRGYNFDVDFDKIEVNKSYGNSNSDNKKCNDTNCKRCYSSSPKQCYLCSDNKLLNDELECGADAEFLKSFKDKDIELNIGDISNEKKLTFTFFFKIMNLNTNQSNDINDNNNNRFLQDTLDTNGNISNDSQDNNSDTIDNNNNNLTSNTKNGNKLIILDKQNKLFLQYDEDNDALNIIINNNLAFVYNKEKNNEDEIIGKWMFCGISIHNNESEESIPAMVSIQFNRNTLIMEEELKSKLDNDYYNQLISVKPETFIISKETSSLYANLRIYSSFIRGPFGVVQNIDTNIKKMYIFKIIQLAKPLADNTIFSSKSNCLSVNEVVNTDLTGLECIVNNNKFFRKENACNSLDIEDDNSNTCPNCQDNCKHPNSDYNGVPMTCTNTKKEILNNSGSSDDSNSDITSKENKRFIEDNNNNLISDCTCFINRFSYLFYDNATCNAEKYINFNFLDAIESKVNVSNRIEYTLEFWMLIHSYNPLKVNPYVIIWDKHMIIKIDNYNQQNSSETINATCYPFANANDLNFYIDKGFIDNTTLNNITQSEWNFIRCSIAFWHTGPKFYISYNIDNKLEKDITEDLPENYKSTFNGQDKVNFIIRADENTSLEDPNKSFNPNVGIVYFKNIRLYSAYLFTYYDTSRVNLFNKVGGYTLNFINNIFSLDNSLYDKINEKSFSNPSETTKYFLLKDFKKYIKTRELKVIEGIGELKSSLNFELKMCNEGEYYSLSSNSINNNQDSNKNNDISQDLSSDSTPDKRLLQESDNDNTDATNNTDSTNNTSSNSNIVNSLTSQEGICKKIKSTSGCDMYFGEYSEENSNCLKCSDAKFLHEDNKCYETCPDRYGGNTDIGMCRLCHDTCKSCVGSAEDECLTCSDDPIQLYLLKNDDKNYGRCIEYCKNYDAFTVEHLLECHRCSKKNDKCSNFNKYSSVEFEVESPNENPLSRYTIGLWAYFEENFNGYFQFIYEKHAALHVNAEGENSTDVTCFPQEYKKSIENMDLYLINKIKAGKSIYNYANDQYNEKKNTWRNYFCSVNIAIGEFYVNNSELVYIQPRKNENYYRDLETRLPSKLTYSAKIINSDKGYNMLFIRNILIISNYIPPESYKTLAFYKNISYLNSIETVLLFAEVPLYETYDQTIPYTNKNYEEKYGQIVYSGTNQSRTYKEKSTVYDFNLCDQSEIINPDKVNGYISDKDKECTTIDEYYPNADISCDQGDYCVNPNKTFWCESGYLATSSLECINEKDGNSTREPNTQKLLRYECSKYNLELCPGPDYSGNYDFTCDSSSTKFFYECISTRDYTSDNTAPLFSSNFGFKNISLSMSNLNLKEYLIEFWMKVDTTIYGMYPNNYNIDRKKQYAFFFAKPNKILMKNYEWYFENEYDKTKTADTIDFDFDRILQSNNGIGFQPKQTKFKRDINNNEWIIVYLAVSKQPSSKTSSLVFINYQEYPIVDVEDNDEKPLEEILFCVSIGYDGECKKDYDSDYNWGHAFYSHIRVWKNSHWVHPRYIQQRTQLYGDDQEIVLMHFDFRMKNLVLENDIYMFKNLKSDNNNNLSFEFEMSEGEYDYDKKINYTVYFDIYSSNNYRTSENELKACPSRCTRCSSDYSCYQCGYDYSLINDECRNVYKYFLQTPNKNKVDYSLSVNELDLFNHSLGNNKNNKGNKNSKMSDLEKFTITFFIRLHSNNPEAVPETANHTCIYFTNDKSNRIDYIANSYKDQKLGLYLNNKLAAQTSVFKYIGKWLHVGVSIQRSQNISVYSHMMHFQVDRKIIKHEKDFDMTKESVVFDSIIIGQEPFALYYDIRLYGSYIIGTYGIVRSKNLYDIYLYRRFDLSSENDYNCIDTNNKMFEDSDFYTLANNEDYETEDIFCRKDTYFELIDFNYKCNNNKNFLSFIAYGYPKNAECKECDENCFLNVPDLDMFKYTDDRKITESSCYDSTIEECSCFLNDYSFYLVEDSCRPHKSLNFAILNEIKFPVRVNENNEMTIEFWLMVYAYNINSFKKVEIIWDGHIRIVIERIQNTNININDKVKYGENGNNLNTKCYPYVELGEYDDYLKNQTTKSSLNNINKRMDFESETIQDKKWVYIRCTVDRRVSREKFAINRNLFKTISEENIKYIHENYENYIEKYSIKEGLQEYQRKFTNVWFTLFDYNPDPNYGVLHIRELKFFSAYLFKEYDPSHKIITRENFKNNLGFLLHYYPFENTLFDRENSDYDGYKPFVPIIDMAESVKDINKQNIIYLLPKSRDILKGYGKFDFDLNLNLYENVCKEGFFLRSDNTCIADNDSSLIYKCRIAHNIQQCILCGEEGLYLHNDDKCYDKCPARWYGNGFLSMCRECHSSCFTCYSEEPNECTSCVEPLYFNILEENNFKGECIGDCSTIGKVNYVYLDNNYYKDNIELKDNLEQIEHNKRSYKQGICATPKVNIDIKSININSNKKYSSNEVKYLEVDVEVSQVLYDHKDKLLLYKVENGNNIYKQIINKNLYNVSWRLNVKETKEANPKYIVDQLGDNYFELNPFTSNKKELKVDIRENYLLQGFVYVFELIINADVILKDPLHYQSKVKQSEFAIETIEKIILNIGKGPGEGNLQLLPLYGLSKITDFTIICRNWISDIDKKPELLLKDNNNNKSNKLSSYQKSSGDRKNLKYRITSRFIGNDLQIDQQIIEMITPTSLNSLEIIDPYYLNPGEIIIKDYSEDNIVVSKFEIDSNAFNFSRYEVICRIVDDSNQVNGEKLQINVYKFSKENYERQVNSMFLFNKSLSYDNTKLSIDEINNIIDKSNYINNSIIEEYNSVEISKMLYSLVGNSNFSSNNEDIYINNSSVDNNNNSSDSLSNTSSTSIEDYNKCNIEFCNNKGKCQQVLNGNNKAFLVCNCDEEYSGYNCQLNKFTSSLIYKIFKDKIKNEIETLPNMDIPTEIPDIKKMEYRFKGLLGLSKAVSLIDYSKSLDSKNTNEYNLHINSLTESIKNDVFTLADFYYKNFPDLAYKNSEIFFSIYDNIHGFDLSSIKAQINFINNKDMLNNDINNTKINNSLYNKLSSEDSLKYALEFQIIKDKIIEFCKFIITYNKNNSSNNYYNDDNIDKSPYFFNSIINNGSKKYEFLNNYYLTNKVESKKILSSDIFNRYENIDIKMIKRSEVKNIDTYLNNLILNEFYKKNKIISAYLNIENCLNMQNDIDLNTLGIIIVYYSLSPFGFKFNAETSSSNLMTVILINTKTGFEVPIPKCGDSIEDNIKLYFPTNEKTVPNINYAIDYYSNIFSDNIKDNNNGNKIVSSKNNDLSIISSLDDVYKDRYNSDPLFIKPSGEVLPVLLSDRVEGNFSPINFKCNFIEKKTMELSNKGITNSKFRLDNINKEDLTNLYYNCNTSHLTDFQLNYDLNVFDNPTEIGKLYYFTRFELYNWKDNYNNVAFVVFILFLFLSAVVILTSIIVFNCSRFTSNKNIVYLKNNIEDKYLVYLNFKKIEIVKANLPYLKNYIFSEIDNIYYNKYNKSSSNNVLDRNFEFNKKDDNGQENGIHYVRSIENFNNNNNKNVNLDELVNNFDSSKKLKNLKDSIDFSEKSESIVDNKDIVSKNNNVFNNNFQLYDKEEFDYNDENLDSENKVNLMHKKKSSISDKNALNLNIATIDLVKGNLKSKLSSKKDKNVITTFNVTSSKKESLKNNKLLKNSNNIDEVNVNFEGKEDFSKEEKIKSKIKNVKISYTSGILRKDNKDFSKIQSYNSKNYDINKENIMILNENNQNNNFMQGKVSKNKVLNLNSLPESSNTLKFSTITARTSSNSISSKTIMPLISSKFNFVDAIDEIRKYGQVTCKEYFFKNIKERSHLLNYIYKSINLFKFNKNISKNIDKTKHSYRKESPSRKEGVLDTEGNPYTDYKSSHKFSNGYNNKLNSGNIDISKEYNNNLENKLSDLRLRNDHSSSRELKNFDFRNKNESYFNFSASTKKSYINSQFDILSFIKILTELSYIGIIIIIVTLLFTSNSSSPLVSFKLIINILLILGII